MTGYFLFVDAQLSPKLISAARLPNNQYYEVAHELCDGNDGWRSPSQIPDSAMVLTSSDITCTPAPCMNILNFLVPHHSQFQEKTYKPIFSHSLGGVESNLEEERKKMSESSLMLKLSLRE